MKLDDTIKYEDDFRRRILSPHLEEEIKEIFSPMGYVKKIPTDSKKRPDFVIESKKIVIEVTSINSILKKEEGAKNNSVPLSIPESPEKLIERINRGIEHAEEKQWDSSYKKICVIHLDDLIMNLTDYFKKITDTNFIMKTSFFESGLDAIMFFPEHIGGNSENKDVLVYVKNDGMKTILEELNNLKIILLEVRDEI